MDSAVDDFECGGHATVIFQNTAAGCPADETVHSVFDRARLHLWILDLLVKKVCAETRRIFVVWTDATDCN